MDFPARFARQAPKIHWIKGLVLTAELTWLGVGTPNHILLVFRNLSIKSFLLDGFSFLVAQSSGNVLWFKKYFDEFVQTLLKLSKTRKHEELYLKKWLKTLENTVNS